MNTSRLALLGAITLFSFSAPHPMPASLLTVTENGVNWLYNYDPDVNLDADYYDKRPEDINNTALGARNRYFGGPGGTGSATINENYLRTVTGVGNKLEYNTAYGYDVSAGNSITIETRLRVVEMTGTQFAGGFLLGAGAVEGSTAEGYYVPIAFSTTRIGDVTGLDLTEWTVIRFTIENAGTASAKLSIYINNSPEASYVGSITSTIAQADRFQRIRFGDYYTAGAAEMDGTVDWDYIRWTSEGAFAPIPEPSTALLPLGGLLVGAYGYAMRRRRN